ncbi:hypothetical protein ROZALSC1DRAFT_31549 [Rozella allomycis CSF55]|uniref:Uncharacterized protein n=1 Tax=Rozella allomycis (strain CSF55) TaxID=988480 RepID=A0A4P9YBS6_ROZAC|nr:hypothetical protein ROZALSC1DRAFT_31549 [Rozella allomycis CSF55]
METLTLDRLRGQAMAYSIMKFDSYERKKYVMASDFLKMNFGVEVGKEELKRRRNKLMEEFKSEEFDVESAKERLLAEAGIEVALSAKEQGTSDEAITYLLRRVDQLYEMDKKILNELTTLKTYCMNNIVPLGVTGAIALSPEAPKRLKQDKAREILSDELTKSSESSSLSEEASTCAQMEREEKQE